MSKRQLAALHVAYYVVGGLWPLVSMRTFVAVTGRKRELWLVRNLAWLMILIGAVLAAAARRGNTRTEITMLGAGSGAVFGAIDVWYVLVRRRIAPTYLLDGVIQLALAVAWARADLQADASREEQSQRVAAPSLPPP